MSNPTVPRTAVLLIQDERSRTVCSVLLRNEGLRVVEAGSIGELLELAEARGADLVLADVKGADRATLHRELVTQLPGVPCLFIRERMLPEAVAKLVRVSIHPEGRDGAAHN
jgi:CheY-like chemotaxis protein